ncbi:MAG: lysophospholipid acyltransferase family protein [Clostridia bacterium]|nr:lysophospholipid acyltransferase family protein [Clostridia bacterium]
MKEFILKVVRLFYKALFKIEIEGVEKIPTDRNFIVTPNHLSNFDPPLIAAFLPADRAYMAKASLFKVPVVAQVIKAFGAFPVKSGEGMSAVRTAIKILREGKSLVIFPEGRRVRTRGILGKGKQGAVLIGAKTGVGILPVGIEATYKFRSRVKVTVGDYIDLSEYSEKKLTTEDIQNITDTVVMERIAELSGARTYGN